MVNSKTRKTRKTRKTKKIQKGGVATPDALNKFQDYKDTCCVDIDNNPIDMLSQTKEFALDCHGKLVKGGPDPKRKLRKKMSKLNSNICHYLKDKNEAAEKFFQKAAAKTEPKVIQTNNNNQQTVQPQIVEPQIVQQQPQQVVQQQTMKKKIFNNNITMATNINQAQSKPITAETAETAETA